MDCDAAANAHLFRFDTAAFECRGSPDQSALCQSLEVTIRVSMSDPEAANRTCSTWAEVVQFLDEFPPAQVIIDREGDLTGAAWVFRGLKNSCYELRPAIEREAQSKSMKWPALEVFISSEFKSRANMHLSPSAIPKDELTWLAQMQHYAVPTRLLDFTYSPFVALYFAIRNSPEDQDRTQVRLWAIDAAAVNYRFRSVASTARFEQHKRDGKIILREVSIGNLADYSTDRDIVIAETHGLETLIAESLSAKSTYRGELNRQGCVCVASPPAFNPRLASQQGTFLLNFAQDLSFNESLIKMMGPCNGWCKTLDIDVGAISEIEGRLFQRNIHEQSLFPDMEGLAGLIRQKIRLHWK
jgi:hypothetical protein